MTERVCKACGGALPTTHGNRRYCSENCRKRKWEREVYRKPCVDCGADIDGHSTRCGDCHNRRLSEQHEALLSRIESMYNAGDPMWKIAEALGRKFERTTDGAFSLPEVVELHRAGRIGYRYKAYERKKAA